MEHIAATQPIGVFDSGIGGLTVVRALMERLPFEHIVYFGDTARVPYGVKSVETITHFTHQIAEFLLQQQVKMLIIACNTMAAVAATSVRAQAVVPVLDVIDAGAIAACAATQQGSIGVIGTPTTVNSNAYAQRIHRLNPALRVYSQACPLFVPLVEEGWTHDPVTVEVASRYLRELQEKDIDTLILGCTHYPLLRSTIGQIMGDGVTLVNPAYETARALRELLKEHGIESDGHEEEEFPYRFYVSDAEERFQEFAGSILPYDVRMTKQINIEEY